MAKVIERESITTHKAQALLFGDPADFTTEELTALEARYPGIQATYAEATAEPGWKLGMMTPPVNFGTEAEPQNVIFMCLGGKDQGYFSVRECIRKLSLKAKSLGLSHVACGILGSGSGGVKVDALEPVIAAAAGSLIVEIYRRPS